MRDVIARRTSQFPPSCVMLDFVPFASFARGANLETDKSSTTAAKAKRVREGRREREERAVARGGRRIGDCNSADQTTSRRAGGGRGRQGLSSVRHDPDRRSTFASPPKLDHSLSSSTFWSSHETCSVRTCTEIDFIMRFLRILLTMTVSSPNFIRNFLAIP